MSPGVKTICKECGHLNALGHIFCVECSARLDLKNVTGEIEHTQEVHKRKKGFKVVLIVLLVLVLIVAGLAFWPSTKPFRREDAEDGTKEKVRSHISTLYTVSQMRNTHMTTRPPLQEEDINAWLLYISEDCGARSVSVKLTDGQIRVRAVCELRLSAPDAKLRLPAIPYSYEITAKPKGSELEMSGATFGHLPLVGFGDKWITGKFEALFAERTREAQVLEKVSNILVEDGQVSVTISTEGS